MVWKMRHPKRTRRSKLENRMFKLQIYDYDIHKITFLSTCVANILVCIQHTFGNCIFFYLKINVTCILQHKSFNMWHMYKYLTVWGLCDAER